MNIKRRLTGAAAVLLACIAALVFAALVPARAIPPSGGRQYHLLNLVVDERYRRRGIASSLLLGAFELGGYLGCSNIRLVTQATNSGAIALYEELGFSNVTSRGRYYRDGSDGIEMERSLKEEAQWWKSANASGRRRLFF